ncbi:MAG TPA: hypothetical protein VL221_13535 [Bacteroidota bacterium]|nr:hypothetical protein [Bacteroidota bacterium]
MGTRAIFALLVSSALFAPALWWQGKPLLQKDIPAPVMEAFHRAYPAARIRGTSTEMEKGMTCYEIESVDGTQARDILYLPNGTVVEVEEAIAARTLLVRVRDAAAKEFPNSEVTKAERVTNGATSSFEIHVRRGAKRGSAVINPEGKVLEKHPLSAPGKKPSDAKKEEDEEEDD